MLHSADFLPDMLRAEVDTSTMGDHADPAELVPALSSKNPRRRQRWAFQRELAERTRHAISMPRAPASQLAVETGDQGLLFDLAHTGEVLPLTNLTSVPLTKPWFLGLSASRGNLIGVVDLSGFLGGPVAPRTKSDKILVCADALGLHCALRVSRVVGLADINAMTPQAVSPGAPAWLVQRYADQAARSWTALDLAALAKDPAFLHIRL